MIKIIAIIFTFTFVATNSFAQDAEQRLKEKGIVLAPPSKPVPGW